jgi:exopolyphosphatase / guanosine-5'-triphosphate,3'-diphosphate pyrophosphatase
MPRRIAIIDMGTNTFHLLIADINESCYTIIHRDRSAVKVGKGGINHGYITEEGLNRAIVAMRAFKNTADQMAVTNVYAFGTSALRNARNSDDVLEKIKAGSGVACSIISGHMEAAYIYEGVKSSMEIGTEKSLIVDIGGGSVECILGNSDRIFWKESFEIGAQRLLEQFQKNDPITPAEIGALNEYFEQKLNPLFDAMDQYPTSILIGASGTFDTLSDVFCFRHNIPKHHDATETPLALQDFYEIHEELIRKNRAERMSIPGMIEMRVDMIVVASCLVKYILLNHSFERIRVSSYSLKEGVLASFVKSKSIKAPIT